MKTERHNSGSLLQYLTSRSTQKHLNKQAVEVLRGLLPCELLTDSPSRLPISTRHSHNHSTVETSSSGEPKGLHRKSEFIGHIQDNVKFLLLNYLLISSLSFLASVSFNYFKVIENGEKLHIKADKRED